MARRSGEPVPMLESPEPGAEPSTRPGREHESPRPGGSEAAIEPLTARDIPAASLLLARVMSGTPIHMAVFRRKDREVVGRQREMFERILQTDPGRTFVARRGARISGAYRAVRWPACRIPPGAAERAASLLGEGMQESLPRLREWLALWGGEDPPVRHWHLGPIAVEEESQGQGIGSGMLRHFCRLLDADREPAYLETDSAANVRLYRRFGFSLTREVELFGVPNFFMWRPPQAAE